MSDRVLNFSEFFTKYSKDGQDDKASLDNLTGAAANFEEGFDKETYDQAPLGPKRPVASGSDTTPPMPGEQGAPAFTSDTQEDMVAPEETAAPVETEPEGHAEEPAETPETPTVEDETEEPAEEEKEESDNEEKEEDETPEPEAGANPKKEEKKVDEGLVMGFENFVNETHEEWNDDWNDDWNEEEDHDDWKEESDDQYDDLLGANPFAEDDDDSGEDEYEYCDNCGEPIYHTVEGASCGCNM